MPLLVKDVFLSSLPLEHYTLWKLPKKTKEVE